MFGFFKKKVVFDQPTARDYALQMHGIISDLPPGIKKDHVFDCLIRIMYPGSHIHKNPRPKNEKQSV